MKFSNSLFFIAAALVSVSSAEEDMSMTMTATGPAPEYTDAPNSSGCSQDTCWASCEPFDDGPSAPDFELSYVDGGNWCWLKRSDYSTPPNWSWGKCEDGCDLHKGDLWCDPDNENACGP